MIRQAQSFSQQPPHKLELWEEAIVDTFDDGRIPWSEKDGYVGWLSYNNSNVG